MKTILIVEDECRIRKVYGAILISAGYQVLEAKDAIVANEMLKEKDVDLVLLDICLPDVTGDELFDVMGMFYQKVKVIVTSVYPLEKQKLMMMGAADYHDKSHGPDELLQKVGAVLSGKG